MSKRTDQPPNTPQPSDGSLWTLLRRSGLRWWRERPWIRNHLVGWAFALGLISIAAIDRTTSAAHGDVEVYVWLVCGIVAAIAVAIGYLVRTLRRWEQLGAVQTISRSLLTFTFLLSVLNFGLFAAGRWGVHIEACRTVRELETCQGQASPRQVLGMLAWHAANVVPVLDITHVLEWPRPARSTNALVGASILALRLWVAIGILGVLKLLWDKWGPIGSSRKSTDRHLTRTSPASTKEGKDR